MNILDEAINILEKGGIILYPTDTIWGIGCDATNNIAVSKIYDIKKRNESKALITLIANKQQLKKHTKIVVQKTKNKKPTTIIYPNVKGLANNLLANDNSAAIRIVQHEFCKKLILKFKKPIVSTSANISGEKYPRKFSEIKKEIIQSVDYIVPLQKKNETEQPSSIIQVDHSGMIIKTIR